MPARILPKEISGANGKFLPKPLLFHLRHPNSKKSSRVFCEILFLQKLYTFHILGTKRSRSCESVPHFLTPQNSFRKTESALVPPPAQKLLGQNTKEKCPFLFQKKFHPRQIRNARSVFLSGLPRLCGAVAGLIHSFNFRSKKVRAKCIITAQNI